MDRIRYVLGTFLNARGIETEQAQLLDEALEVSSREDVDFVDAVLALRAREADQTVVTFDESDVHSLPVEWILPENISSG